MHVVFQMYELFYDDKVLMLVENLFHIPKKYSLKKKPLNLINIKFLLCKQMDEYQYVLAYVELNYTEQ